MKKKPIKLLLGLSAVVTFGLGFIFYYHRVLLENFDQYVLEREEHILNYAEVGKILGKYGAIDALNRILTEATRQKHLDFFIIQYQGEALFWSTHSGKPDAILQTYKETEIPQIEEKYTLLTTKISQDKTLTVGINKLFGAYVKTSFQDAGKNILEEVIWVSLLALALFSFFLRDIYQLFTTLRTKQNRDYSEIRPQSKESEVMLRGLMGYESTIYKLECQNRTLGDQVLPALKSEIFSGQKPPYEFYCTLIRTDINNFSTIFQNHNTDQFMELINDFFKKTAHIVSRYRGLIYEFIGDEVIFYFRDQDHQNSFAQGLAAIRDIETEAKFFDQKARKDYGYPFTIKTSLAHGKIRFGHQVNGFSLAGSSLIETVRILSNIAEKEGNMIYFDSRHLSIIPEIFSATGVGDYKLKGLRGKRSLYRISQTAEVKQYLNHFDDSFVALLPYFRHDDHLIKIFEFLQAHIRTIPPYLFHKILQVLREIEITESDPEVTKCLSNLCDALYKQRNNSKNSMKIFGACIMLFKNLVPVKQFNNETESQLRQYLATTDRRTVANIIEILTHFKSGGDQQFFETLLKHENNRIQANAILHEGYKGLTPKIYQTLKAMVFSKKAHHIASGIYAIGELALHYKEKDLIYFSAQLDLHYLIENLTPFTQHPDTMVRRQAFLSIQKINDPVLLNKVHRELYNDGRHDLLV